MITVDALIAQARQWVGVRFLHQGRSRFGCDCMGFICACLAELGSDVLLDNLPINYPRNPQAQLVDGLVKLCREVKIEAGALLLIKLPRTEHASHAAIYTGETMIHSFQSEGKVIEHSYSGPWVTRTVSSWALPLVIYQ